MFNELTETLRILRVERKKEALKKGWKEVPELVFCTEAGEHLDTGRLDDFWMQPDATPAHPETKKGLAATANPLKFLVAGTGFEPVTFGL